MVEPQTYIRRTAKKETRKDIIKKCLKSTNSYSIIAVDSNNEIMGIKLGYMTHSKAKHSGSMYYPWLKHFYWALPETMVNFNIVGWHMEVNLGYHPKTVMKELVS